MATKQIKRVIAAERIRAQAERPSLFLTNPAGLNRTAPRFTPKPRKGTRAANLRRALNEG